MLDDGFTLFSCKQFVFGVCDPDLFSGFGKIGSTQRFSNDFYLYCDGGLFLSVKCGSAL